MFKKNRATLTWIHDLLEGLKNKNNRQGFEFSLGFLPPFRTEKSAGNFKTSSFFLHFFQNFSKGNID